MGFLYVPNFSIQLETSLQYYFSGDDFWLTSAFCEKDNIQWIYYREIVRGYSDFEKLSCKCCGDKLILEDGSESGFSCSMLPEIIGWLDSKGKTLHAVILESCSTTIRDSLLEHILRHDFSKYFTTLEEYRTSLDFHHTPGLIEKRNLSPKLLANTWNLKSVQKRLQKNLKESQSENQNRNQKRKKLEKKLGQSLSFDPLKPRKNIVIQMEKRTQDYLAKNPENPTNSCLYRNSIKGKIGHTNFYNRLGKEDFPQECSHTWKHLQKGLESNHKLNIRKQVYHIRKDRTGDRYKSSKK